MNSPTLGMLIDFFAILCPVVGVGGLIAVGLGWPYAAKQSGSRGLIPRPFPRWLLWTIVGWVSVTVGSGALVLMLILYALGNNIGTHY